MRLPHLAASLLLLLALATVATSAAPAPAPAARVDWSQAVGCDGSLPREGTFAEPAHPALLVQVDAFCADEAPALAAATDCARTTYGLLSYKWYVPYAAQVDTRNPSGLPDADVLRAFQDAFATWDAATGAAIAGPIIQAGDGAHAGTLDGVHQIGWKPLAGGTLAVTITWYAPTLGRPALESDAAYNTNYAWGFGASGRYDVQGIATHEAGHAFGLGDLYNSADACLTMYGYGYEGDTKSRTLGDGDILGIRHLYG